MASSALCEWLCAAGLAVVFATSCNQAKADKTATPSQKQSAQLIVAEQTPAAQVVAHASGQLPRQETKPAVLAEQAVAPAASTRMPPAASTRMPPAEKSAAPAEPLSASITVTLKITARVAARVRMGSKKMGSITPGHPLVIERLRDSGPLDLVIRATGYIPVHTRAYTFEDSVFTVTLTKREEQESLYGYRKPLPPVDAGVPLASP